MDGILPATLIDKRPGHSRQHRHGGKTLTLYEQWRQDPRVELVPEPRGLERTFREALQVVAGQRATKAVADCYLVGFAEAGGANLVMFDRGLAGTSQARNISVTLLQPV